MFIAMFGFGMALIGISFFMLPYIVLTPHKVSMLLNLGSLCILSSFGILKGFYQYFVIELLGGKRRWLALGYILSILFSLYSSSILKNYLVTIGALLIEVSFNHINSNYLDGILDVLYLFKFSRRLNRHELFDVIYLGNP